MTSLSLIRAALVNFLVDRPICWILATLVSVYVSLMAALVPKERVIHKLSTSSSKIGG